MTVLLTILLCIMFYLAIGFLMMTYFICAILKQSSTKEVSLTDILEFMFLWPYSIYVVFKYFDDVIEEYESKVEL